VAGKKNLPAGASTTCSMGGNIEILAESAHTFTLLTQIGGAAARRTVPKLPSAIRGGGHWVSLGRAASGGALAPELPCTSWALVSGVFEIMSRTQW